MIINSCVAYSEREANSYSWGGLARFKNVAHTTRVLTEVHQVPKRQHENVRKQATQIRHCLIQAEQYFGAAAGVSDSIRPLLLYYGAMSLGLCEILFKGTGADSLDKSRGKHAHHGLELRVRDNPSRKGDLKSSAECLRAVPHVLSSGERAGTFELWHNGSRESPITGRVEKIIGNGHSQIGHEMVAIPNDKRPQVVQDNGFNLLWCFRHTPDLLPILHRQHIPSLLVRGSWSRVEFLNEGRAEDTLFVHPHVQSVIDECLNKFVYPANAFENLVITELPSGVAIKKNSGELFPLIGGSYPIAFQHSSDRVFWCSDNDSLNEFGVYYIGLYILGNYCRYYPDMWMNDLETSSDLYIMSVHFMDAATRMLPILSAAEMNQTYPCLRVA